MVNFALKPKHFSSSTRQRTPFNSIINTCHLIKHTRLHLFTSKRSKPTHQKKLRIFAGIKEKGDIVEEDRTIVTRLQVEDSEKSSAVSGEGSSVLGLNWLPWKNIPERYTLIGTTSLAFVVCNMDKVNLSIAIIPMSHQFGWNSSMAGLVQSSFFWGYALSQLPGGWLAKAFGGEKVGNIPEIKKKMELKEKPKRTVLVGEMKERN